MKQAQWIEQGIRLGNRFHYRKKNPWRHNALNLSILSTLLVGIGFVIAEGHRARRWNRRFGWLISIPFGINYRRHWEEGHHSHHIHPLEAEDPQTANLWTGARFVREFFLMLFVPGYVFL